MASIYCHELQMFHCNPMPKNIQLMQVSIFSYSKDQCHNIDKYSTIVKKSCKYYRQRTTTSNTKEMGIEFSS